MRILQINSTLNWGSTGHIAEEIGHKIIEDGGKSYIAYGRHAKPTQSEGIKMGNKWAVYYHVLQTRLFDRHGLASKKATLKLVELIKDINPDIIHLHNIHGYYLNYQILFSYLNLTKIPVVWTLHDCWSFTGHCAHYMGINCTKWQSLCCDCEQKNSYPSSLFFDNSKNNFLLKRKLFCSVDNLTLVPVSKWLSNELKKSYLQNLPFRIIHNGIDINIFCPRLSIKTKLFQNNDFLILGVSSVWTETKGLPDFIKLRKLLPMDYAIILIGVSSKQINSLPEGIIGIERTNNVEELATYYSSADVFFNPTWEDTFPTTNLEALACGTPVITYRTGGSPEAIDEHTGFVVEKGNLNEAIRAIEQIKSVGKSKYTQTCRKRAVEHFNKIDRYAEYLQLYNEILKNE